jgi:anthranilate phosphoribosyltransferase
MPIRKSLNHRTIFNILGPLTNPAGAKKYLLGVFSSDFIEKMAKALVELDAKKAFVVSSRDGMDEISISDLTDFAYVENSKVTTGVINPQEFGFKLAPKEAILGGDAKQNAKITLDILSGKEMGPKRDVVLLNSAYALFANESARDIKEGIEIAKDALDSKKAYNHLQIIIDVSNSF